MTNSYCKDSFISFPNNFFSFHLGWGGMILVVGIKLNWDGWDANLYPTACRVVLHFGTSKGHQYHLHFQAMWKKVEAGPGFVLSSKSLWFSLPQRMVKEIFSCFRTSSRKQNSKDKEIKASFCLVDVMGPFPSWKTSFSMLTAYNYKSYKTRF